MLKANVGALSYVGNVTLFDADGMLLDAELVDGRELEGAIERLFADARMAYLQAHFAKPGCYAARIERA